MVCMLVSIFFSWLGYAAQMHSWKRLIIRRAMGVVLFGLLALGMGIIAASISIGTDGIRQYRQAWCHGGETWYVATFRFLPVAASLVPMLMTVVPPLLSGRVNEDQKNLMVRRMVGHLVWAIMITYASTGTMFKDSHFGKLEQAVLEPLSAVALALGFLISERMLTFRALGLPPGADPPYGFTNAMHYIPDKLSYDDTASLLRDTTLHHNIVKA